MRSEDIHQGMHGKGRIMLHDLFHLVRRTLGISLADKGNDRILHRIVHHGIETASVEIVLSFLVGDLVGRILPDLADHKRVFLLTLGCADDLPYGARRVLIDHIETPAGGSCSQPVAHDAFLAGNKIHVAGVVHIGLRQSVDPPPRIIGPVLMEAVPVSEGRIGRVPGTDASVISVTVKVTGIGTGMGEHAVQNDTDPALIRFPAELLEILLRSEHRVDLKIIAGIVFMIGGRLEDRA